MLHDNKNEFAKILERTAAQTSFPLRLLEKDYYITIVLSNINKLSNNLVFKGGTCLSKIYYSYYRLSEDLDFTLKLSDNKSTRKIRSNAMQPLKKSLKPFLNKIGMSVRNLEKAGHRESTQYVYYLEYSSVVLSKREYIKLEVGIRFNPLSRLESKKVNHKFLHPFTKEPLFEGGIVNCLGLKELVAEKMRAAATRKTIASRDFYDLGFLLSENFNFTDKDQIKLFKKKLKEDNYSTDLQKYRINLGRTNAEIEDMLSRMKDELVPVLTLSEQEKFDIKKTLTDLNRIFRNLK